MKASYNVKDLLQTLESELGELEGVVEDYEKWSSKYLEAAELLDELHLETPEDFGFDASWRRRIQRSCLEQWRKDHKDDPDPDNAKRRIGHLKSRIKQMKHIQDETVKLDLEEYSFIMQ